MRKALILLASVAIAACTAEPPRDLPRAQASPEFAAAFQTFQDSVAASLTDPTAWNEWINLHSIMVVKDGKVIAEKWFGEFTPDKPHTMYSISKTFTAAAVGMAIAEGKLSLDDKVTEYFQDVPLPAVYNPCNATVKDLLMMAGGHDTDPTIPVLDIDRMAMTSKLKEGVNIPSVFFTHPFLHEPGTYFWYNSLGTYILSYIVQKVTGECILDYLTPRLFEPLGIDKPEWEADNMGVNCGGWGLSLKTEDMAKFGQLLLQEGRWGRRQLIPADWVREMGTKHIDCAPAQITIEDAEAVCGIPASENDWRQGYGYQTWINKVDGFRADGAGGQFILVLPEKNAVVAVTAWLSNTQKEMDFIWDYIYPYL
ncbi:MAG: serine hydrolase [Bacteroidales bacterium]|nr:serine hydrolase [Bacteroidales bacterium]